MPLPSIFDVMPSALREELETKLKENGFGDYHALAKWLGENGYQVGHATVGRFGKEFKERCDSLRLAREMAIEYRKALPEDDGATSEILNEVGKGLALSYAFAVQQALVDNDFGTVRAMMGVVGAASRAIESINRSDIAVSKYASELKDKQAAKFAELEEQGAKEGITLDFLQRVKSEILRIV